MKQIEKINKTPSSLEMQAGHLNFYQGRNIEEHTDLTFIDCNNSLVFDENKKIHKITLCENIWWKSGWLNFRDKDVSLQIKARENQIQEYVDQIPISKVKNLAEGITYIHLMHAFGHYAFGHIFDTLEKVLLIDELNLKNKNICILLSDCSRVGGIKIFTKYLKALLPDLPFTVKQAVRGELWGCRDLILLKPLAHPSCISSHENLFKIHERFVSYFKQFTPSKQYSKKIFLTRTSPSNRHIINSHELHLKLESNDISILYGNEPIEDMFHAFYNATHIVGYHGAMFINQIFCQNPLVVEINSSKRRHTSLSSKFFQIKTTYHFEVEADEKHNAVLDINAVLNFYTEKFNGYY